MNTKATSSLAICTATAILFLGSQATWAGDPLPSPQPIPQLMGQIDGIVLKASGAVIVGARVQLMTESGKVLKRQKTASDGQFQFSRLAAGKYWVYTTFDSMEDKQLCIIRGGSVAEMKVVLEP
jgi:hypothetical protein